MKDILVILTGGTIGSRCSDGVISPKDDSPFDLIRMYEETSGKVGCFECIQPFTILSENTGPGVWSELIKTLSYVDFSKYKGIIITHGTDTLSYTASLLGLLYEGLAGCPIVLVSSNLVLTKANSNGLQNFLGAVDLIEYLSKTGMYNDVYVSWSSDFFKVIRGSELLEADTAIDDFGIYGNQAFLEFYPDGIDFETGGYAWRPVPNNMHENLCLSINTKEDRRRIIEGECMLDAKLLAIKSYPGLDYSNISINTCDAVMVYSYHSSTFCTGSEDKNLNLKTLLDKCHKAGKRVYLSSFKKDNKEIYESLESIIDMSDIIKLEDQSFESAYLNAFINESLKK